MWKEQKEGQKSLWYGLLLSEEIMNWTKREPPPKKKKKKRTKPLQKGKREKNKWALWRKEGMDE
jgi:hypothetical protein